MAIGLTLMHDHRVYVQGGYPSFEAYLADGPRISKKLAYRAIESLRTFGPEKLRELRLNIGAQRTFCLAQIQKLDPATCEELLDLPAIDGKPGVTAIPVNELEQIVDDLKGRLSESYDRYRDLADELAATKQIMGKTSERIAQIDQLNRDLVIARDKAERDGKRAKEELEQARKKAQQTRRDLERKIADLDSQLTNASNALRQLPPRPAASPAPAPAPIVQQVIAAGDPVLLADLARLCATALRRYRDQALKEASAPPRELSAAIAALIADSDLSLLIPTIQACTTALRRYTDQRHLAPAEGEALFAALNEFVPAAKSVHSRDKYSILGDLRQSAN